MRVPARTISAARSSHGAFLMSRVRKAAVPQGTLVASAFPRPSYEDAFAIKLPKGAATDVDELTWLIANSPAPWARALMRLRNRIVAPFGLRTSDPPATGRAEGGTLKPGDRAGIFPVLARADDEVLLGADDRHLDFRASVLLRRGEKRDSVVLSTVVRYNNLLGRVYFLFVWPFHGAIVSASLRNAVRRLRR